MTAAIDAFLADMRLQGRISSSRSERSYRTTLTLHARDVGNRDPRATNRRDVKRTLARWTHPNTQGTCRAHLVSFYRWLVREGLRGDNPAEQTHPPRRRRPTVYRLTPRMAQKLLGHADLGTTEAYLGEPTLDDLARAVAGITFAPGGERAFSPLAATPAVPVEATTGIEPVVSSSRVVERFSAAVRTLFESEVLRRAAREMAASA